ncbi:hypothetical protein KAW64_13180 [bacterium]|nr:hypothetical protein [bacterium]
MLSWLAVLGAAVHLWAATGSLAEPLELRPYHETLVVEAPFGEGEGMFAPRSESWGRGEVGGFGPFAVAAGGTIYIADTKANDIKIFAPDGSFVRATDMRRKNNVVHDLAICDGRIFWMDEAFGGRAYVSVLDPVNGDTELIGAILPSSNRRHAFGDCRLVVTDEGVSVYYNRAGKSYPVYQNGRALSAREQEEKSSVGLCPTEAPPLAFTWERTTTADGEETHGDIVRLTPDGRPEKILVRNAGSIRGAASSCFLHTRVEQERPYVVLTDYEGETLARTEMPKRGSGRAIDIPHRWRLAQDCSYYELYLTERSVCVARWSAE